MFHTQTFVFVYIREFGCYNLFGTCWTKGNHSETTKDNWNILSGTQPIVKQSDFALPCNINNFDGIENGGGWLGSFKWIVE